MLPYVGTPWELAKLVDNAEPHESKIATATWFMNLESCCLDVGFGQPLREWANSAEDLLPHGRYHTLLKGAFQGHPFNVEIEDSFARVKNQQQTTRGRSELSHNVSAKHFLSEFKMAHLLHLDLGIPTVDAVVPAAEGRPVGGMPLEEGGDNEQQQKTKRVLAC